MCYEKAFVLTRDAIFWDERTDSHREIICKNGLCSWGRTRGPLTVSVELNPPRDARRHSPLEIPIEEWTFTLHQRELPSWWDGAEGLRRTQAAGVKWLEGQGIYQAKEEPEEAEANPLVDAAAKIKEAVADVTDNCWTGDSGDVHVRIDRRSADSCVDMDALGEERGETVDAVCADGREIGGGRC